MKPTVAKNESAVFSILRAEASRNQNESRKGKYVARTKVLCFNSMSLEKLQRIERKINQGGNSICSGEIGCHIDCDNDLLVVHLSTESALVRRSQMLERWESFREGLTH
jgi:hypothetical protein